VDGNADEDDANALPLVFLCLKFPYNFEPGSESSIKFLDCLKDANNETFRSKTVQAILNYKWYLARHQAYALAIVYAFYILCLFINIEFD
jgi:hypothetical protein